MWYERKRDRTENNFSLYKYNQVVLKRRQFVCISVYTTKLNMHELKWERRSVPKDSMHSGYLERMALNPE